MNSCCKHARLAQIYGGTLHTNRNEYNDILCKTCGTILIINQDTLKLEGAQK